MLNVHAMAGQCVGRDVAEAVDIQHGVVDAPGFAYFCRPLKLSYDVVRIEQKYSERGLSHTL